MISFKRGFPPKTQLFAVSNNETVLERSGAKLEYFALPHEHYARFDVSYKLQYKERGFLRVGCV